MGCMRGVDWFHLPRWKMIFCSRFLWGVLSLKNIFSDGGLILETSAFQIFNGGNSIFIKLFDKTKFSCFNAYILAIVIQSQR